MLEKETLSSMGAQRGISDSHSVDKCQTTLLERLDTQEGQRGPDLDRGLIRYI